MRRPLALLAVTAAVALAGCTAEDSPVPAETPSTTPSAAAGGVEPTGEPRAVASELAAPWDVVRLDDGTVLVSERDTARIVRIADGAPVPVGDVPGVVPGNEGGLLGIATLDDGGATWLYAYLTAADDNRIVRMPLAGAGADLALGDAEVVLAGIPKSGVHNGGRIEFGPDGMLYATTGDASDRDLAQDPASLAGKILRIAPDGAVPADNPAAGSLVYSLGHRNPQGLAWTDDGGLWASEFGQDTWDELNRIEPGANYGWPVVEGIAGDDRFVDPVAQWAPDEASPSGLAFVDGTFFMAALGGERLWVVQRADPGRAWAQSSQVSSAASLVGEVGRIRDVMSGPEGTLWFMTNNTDGRGEPREGDDRLLEVDLTGVG